METLYATDVKNRLADFDPKSVEFLPLKNGTIHPEVFRKMTEAADVLQVAKVELEKENLTLLEYAVYRLKAIFTSTGCQKLAFVCEVIHQNISRVQIDSLRYLLAEATEDFQQASRIIKKHIALSAASTCAAMA